MKRRAEEVEALRPALDAFRRGTKRSRLRVLTVVCPAGHTLFEVFPTTPGLVALWKSREVVQAEDGSASWADQWYAEEIGSDAGDDAWSTGALGACRCVKVVQVQHDWVRRQIADGRQRAVAEELAPQAPEVDWFG